MGYIPWGCKESDMTEQLTFSFLSVLQHNVQKCLRDQNNSFCTVFPARRGVIKSEFLFSTPPLSFPEYTGWDFDRAGKDVTLSCRDDCLLCSVVS